MSEPGQGGGSLLVYGGVIVEPEGERPETLWVQDGRVAGRFGPNAPLPAAARSVRVVDANGLMIVPGGVDVHVHLRDPGLTHKEDLESGTRAAAVGGVTTVLDMPNTVPPVLGPDDLADKFRLAERRLHVDCGFYGLVGPANQARLGQLADRGAVAFKLFLGPTTGDLRAPEGEALVEACRAVAQTGLPLAVHAEDRAVIEAAAGALPAESPWDYDDFLRSRPRPGEIEATRMALGLALRTGARVHIAHVATREAVQAIREAKRRGAAVTAETCPHYLLLTSSAAPQLGTQLKVLPPIRGDADRDALWEGLADGTLDLVSTDHAPHTADEKRGSFREAAAGASGLETLLPLLLDQAARGRITHSQVVRWTARRPAAVFGLHPAKGWLGPGADADFVLWDSRGETVVDSATMAGKSGNTPFHGRTLQGRIRAVYLRGRLIAADVRAQPEKCGRVIGPGGSPVHAQ